MDFDSVYSVIGYINDHCETPQEKGDMWERAVVFYLRHDPEMRQLMSDVRLWEDAATNDGRDAGIDVVAEHDPEAARVGERRYWGVQCKNYDPAHKLGYEELADFWANAEADERYAGYIVVSAADFTSTVYECAEATHTLMITPEKMDESNVDWNSFINQTGPGNRETYDLREHQRLAIDGINATLEGRDRCKAILACGTGKTLMSLRLAEGRCPHGTVLFAAPSIALVSQAMREWTNQARVPMRSLVVCSDAKASLASDSDEPADTLADLAFPATTDAEGLVSHYRYVRSKAPDAMVAVFATYQSMQAVADAQASGLDDFDLIVCDEAHRTTGYKTRDDEDTTAFLIVHDQARVHGAKRVYMTATPRIYGDQVRRTAREQDYVLASMDDEAIYGPVAYELTFSEAVERGLLCDYRVVVLAVREESMPDGMQFTLSDGSELQMDEAAKIIGCYKGLATHGVVAQRRANRMFEKASPDVPEFLLIDEAGDLEDSDGPAGSDGSDGPDDSGDAERPGRPEPAGAAPDREGGIEPLHRAVGFCRSIQDSKAISEMFERVVAQYRAQAHGDERYDLTCSVDHVDGSMNSRVRHQKLDWLASGHDPQGCRILTNARCLAEGVDVPSLDAVIFFSPRKSEVDVVQAVGRVMRTFKNERTGAEKRLGYIILPVFVPEGLTPEDALGNSKSFDVVWKVLQGLRSHDERIEAYVNSLQFRERGAGVGPGVEKPVLTLVDDQDPGEWEQLQIDGFGELAEAVYAKAVDKVGTRVYWDSWAGDVAHIAERHIEQINDVLANDSVAREGFDTFLEGLRDTLNPGITEDDAIEMVAQHMIMLPVFTALFGDFRFAKSNPVATALDVFLEKLEGHGVGDMSASERRTLDDLYASVGRRARVARSDGGRQALIKNLYEEFFRVAFKKTTEKLGVVYTPNEIVDYILHATDRTLRREFGTSLGDEGVHILDPFAGTGTFIARLIEDDTLIPLRHLTHKYIHDLHSNEILLLAYYIMVVNIEYAYHERARISRAFDGALLADTFQMSEDDNKIDSEFFRDNTLRMQKQQDLDITVIVGNPPYSGRQANASDNNANERYPTLDERIRGTYSVGVNLMNKNSFMDSYIRAFRWASDRISRKREDGVESKSGRGIVCFVSSAAWLRSAPGAGVRRALVKEFNSIYVFDLRGNQRLQGEACRREGERVFGSGSRSPIAITMLVKNPDSSEHGMIHYFDVGDYKSRKEKLRIVGEAVKEEPAWRTIVPDVHGDWFGQREESFYLLAPMGLGEGRNKTSLGLFSTWSRGVSTAKDAWVWNFDKEKIKENVRGLIKRSNEVILACDGSTDDLDYDPTRFAWNRETLRFLERGETFPFEPQSIVLGSYRPFNKQWLYSEPKLMDMNYLQDKLFPLMDESTQAPNLVIVTSTGPKASSLITSNVPDLHFVGDGQCFPMFTYEPVPEGGGTLFSTDDDVVCDAWGKRYIRHDTIKDRTVAVFQRAYPDMYSDRDEKYGGPGINKDDIFCYVYGVLHSPVYRETYAVNLYKELPRIPLTRHFEEFANAGRKLAHLHLNYDKVEPWPTVSTDILRGMDPDGVERIRWAKKTDRKTGKRVTDYTGLVYNKRVRITGIPEEARNYVVNGRSPIEWVIERYQVREDAKTGIVNDPNDFSDDPWYIVDLIARLVRVSMETQEIVESLPDDVKEVPHPDNWPAEWSARRPNPNMLGQA